ncbi:MAG: hypothetical protein ACREU7_03710 [Burkholderiales bacterium]
MKPETRQRWLLLGGLLVVTLATAAWVGDRTSPDSEVVAASEPDSGTPSSPAISSRHNAPDEAPQVNLEKLQSRDLGTTSRDPFAVRKPRVDKPRPPAPAVPAVQVVAAPPPPSAPPLPFTYIGRLVEGDDVAVFLSQGDRNLVVRQGETIDSIYRVEHVAENAITLTYLPLDQRQTIVIGDPR